MWPPKAIPETSSDMKTILIVAAFTACMAAPTFAGNDPQAPCETKLDYKFYKNSTKRNYYNLAYANKAREAVTVKILNAAGEVVQSKRFREKTLSTSFDLNDLKDGDYTVEIYAGDDCKVSTETVSVK